MENEVLTEAMKNKGINQDEDAQMSQKYTALKVDQNYHNLIMNQIVNNNSSSNWMY